MFEITFPLWVTGAVSLCRVSNEGYVITYPTAEGEVTSEVLTGIAALFQRIVVLTGKADWYGNKVHIVNRALQNDRLAVEIEAAIEILGHELKLAREAEELLQRAEEINRQAMDEEENDENVA